jgi:general secretion pathway protein A
MTGPFCSFFDLRDNPFRANPDPRYLFLTVQAQCSLEQIMEGIRARKGLLLLTGEVGTGKTVLIHHLLERLAQDATPRAFIFNSHLNVNELFEMILAEFAIPFVPQRGTPLAHLNSWLHDRFRAGQTPVLFVDEAQGLPSHVLEELRLLLNLQTPQGNLLQIVLSGQPEFEEVLRRPDLRQIRQRVALRCRTSPLTLNETFAYIESRLHFAGAADASAIFQPEAVQALFLYSRGIPRVLNLLCEQSLMRAAGENVRPVPVRIIGEAAQEFQYDNGRKFVPVEKPDEAFFSGLFAPRPAYLQVSDVAPVGSNRHVAQPDAGVAGHPDVPAQSVASATVASASAATAQTALNSQPARRMIPTASQSSTAPIIFPSRNQRPLPPAPVGDEVEHLETSTPSDLLIAELSAASCRVAPASNPRTKAWHPPDPGRLQHWKHNAASIATQARAVSAALKFRTRKLLRHLGPAVVRGRASVLQQANLLWNVLRRTIARANFPGIAASSLNWLRTPSLRTPSDGTQPHHAAARTPAHDTLPAATSAVVPADSSPVSMPDSKFYQALESPRLASILNWLRQPTSTLRNRERTRPPTSRIA